MQLDWVELLGFRSYPALRFEPDSGVNVLVGRNGAGKSNLLEAVAYLGLLKSFRGAPDDAMRAFDAEAAVLRAEVSQLASTALVEIELPEEGRRRIQVNKTRLARHADIVEHVRVVVFMPDDLDLVKRGPGYRREWVDGAASQLWPIAGREQQEYARAVRQRNSLLRDFGRNVDRKDLDVWTERMSQAGATLMMRRLDTLRLLEPHMNQAYRALGGGQAEVDIEYESSWGGHLGTEASEDEFESLLLSSLEDTVRLDMDRRQTTRGPHRDDTLLLIGGHPARTQASQGEQRSLALAMRTAVHSAVHTTVGESPILLLDDVFSELDAVRSEALADYLPESQTFITTARPEDVPLRGRSWEVTPGDVQESDVPEGGHAP